jgi:hypothetical protein
MACVMKKQEEIDPFLDMFQLGLQLEYIQHFSLINFEIAQYNHAMSRSNGGRTLEPLIFTSHLFLQLSILQGLKIK